MYLWYLYINTPKMLPYIYIIYTVLLLSTASLIISTKTRFFFATLLITSADICSLNSWYTLLENNLVTITSVEDIFNCIVEICVLIGVNYNDNVVYSYLTKSKVNTFDKSKLVDEFIHVKSEQNGMLFKIIVRGCRLIREHYKPQTTFQFTKKILFLFDQALKLFSIADNFYYEKVSEITEEDLTNFYERYKKIQNNKQLSSQALTAGILQDELKPVLSSTYLNPSSRVSETSRSNPLEENKKDSLFIL